MRKFGALVCAVLLSAAAAFPAVSVKLTGGAVFLFGNDYTAGVRGTYDSLKANYENVTGSPRSLTFGTLGAAEVIIPLDEMLSLGVGAGVIQASADKEFGYSWWTYAGTESFAPRLTLVPVTINMHYLRPLGKALDVDVFAGAGAYLMRFRSESRSTSSFFGYDVRKTFSAQEAIFGLQLGIALELRLFPHAALVLQSEGRVAKSKYVKGDWTVEESWLLGSRRSEGTDALFWAYSKTDAAGTYRQAEFSVAEPSDAAYENVRKGTLDISGISASAGIKISF